MTNGREPAEGGVGDRVGVWVKDGLGLIRSKRAAGCELCMLSLLVVRSRVDDFVIVCVGKDVVRAEVEGTQDIEGDGAVEAEPIKADRCDLDTALVKGLDL